MPGEDRWKVSPAQQGKYPKDKEPNAVEAGFKPDPITAHH